MTYNQTRLWRQQYNNITQLKVADDFYIVRPLALYEIVFITEHGIDPVCWTNLLNEPKFEYFPQDEIFDIVHDCILWPENPDLESKAGTSSTIFAFLYQQSLLSDKQIKELTLQSEAKTRNKMAFLKAVLLAAFPALKPQDVDNFNIGQLFDLAGLAITVLELRSPNNKPSLDPLTKVAKQKKTQGIDFDAENKLMQKGGELQGDLDPLATKRQQMGR